MIENELLFLGLLKDGPKHGYEIKRLIADEPFQFIGLKVKSIYYPLKKMEKNGLIKKQTGRDGKFPEKYVYSLTGKGKKAFDGLITNSLLSIERPFFDIDLSLYFLQYVDPKVAKRQLRGRIMYLKKIKQNILKIQERISVGESHMQAIMEHNADLVEAEIKSTTKLTESLH